MKRGIILLTVLGLLLTCSIGQKQPDDNVNPMNLTAEQNQYVEERQLTYLTSGSQREADHFAIARLYQNPQGKLTILVNYVQNNAVAALTRRLYIMEGVWESESPSASAYAHWVVDQRHFYWDGKRKEYSAALLSEAYPGNSRLDETSLLRDCRSMRLPLSDYWNPRTIYGYYIIETDAPAEDAYHLMMWLILEKPVVKMKLGALELTPRTWDNYEYRLRLDLWKY